MTNRANSLVAVAAILCGGAGPLLAQASPNAAKIVAELIRPYTELESFRIRAELDFGTTPREPRSVTLEYWESASGFRIDSDVSQALVRDGYAGGQIQTFDGSDSRLLWKALRTLLLKSGELPNGAVGPNPLFLPLAFLDLESPLCVQCRPSFRDVRNALMIGGIGADFHLEVVSPSPASYLLTVPAKQGRGPREVHLEAAEGGLWVKDVSIYAGDGLLSSRYSFSNPSPVVGSVSTLLLGRRILMEGWQPGTGSPGAPPLSSVVATIEIAVAGEAIPAELFTIASATPLADTVIDEDTHELQRARSCNATNTDGHK